MPHLADVLWIISGPGRAGAAVLRGRCGVGGWLVGALCPVLSVTRSLHDILGINWSFMCVAYIIWRTCVWMRVQSAGEQGGCGEPRAGCTSWTKLWQNLWSLLSVNRSHKNRLQCRTCVLFETQSSAMAGCTVGIDDCCYLAPPCFITVKKHWLHHITNNKMLQHFQETQ